MASGAASLAASIASKTKTKKKHFMPQKKKLFRSSDPLLSVLMWGVNHSVSLSTPIPGLIPHSHLKRVSTSGIAHVLTWGVYSRSRLGFSTCDMWPIMTGMIMKQKSYCSTIGWTKVILAMRESLHWLLTNNYNVKNNPQQGRACCSGALQPHVGLYSKWQYFQICKKKSVMSSFFNQLAAQSSGRWVKFST